MDKTPEEIADELLAKAGISSSQKAQAKLDCGELLPPPSAPMAVARRFVEARCLNDGKPDELMLRYWCGCWWVWRTTHWVEAEPRTVRASLWHFTEHAVYLDDIKIKPWLPNRYKIGDLLEALSAIVILPDDFEQPGWLDGRESGPIVATSNGLRDITSHVAPTVPTHAALFQPSQCAVSL
jgi:putative DNA primase/helicase